jgi:hypothetical protein
MSKYLLGYNQVGGGNDTFKVGVCRNDSISCSQWWCCNLLQYLQTKVLKDNITNSTVGLDCINDLRPVTYKWKAEKDVPIDMPHYNRRVLINPVKRFGKTHYGFIAQEVKAVIDNYNLVDGQTMS